MTQRSILHRWVHLQEILKRVVSLIRGKFNELSIVHWNRCNHWNPCAICVNVSLSIEVDVVTVGPITWVVLDKLWKASTAFDDEDTNRPTNEAQTTSAGPRHGPPKMPVVNAPASADLEELNPLDEIDEEDLTEEDLRAEVLRRDRAQAAWLPRPAADGERDVDCDQHEVLDG